MAADTRPLLWLVDKPAGPTSHDVVAQMRRGLPRSVKVGHAGTLDPFATGLMVVLSGRATRVAEHMSGLDKGYLATIRTGFTSATGDPEGPITPDGAPAPAAEIAAVLPALSGRQTQRVPAFSAVRVDGERLYARARRGEDVDAPVREVVIHRLSLVDDLGEGRAVIAVRCSKGTYIRSLAEDIGRALGVGAYCEALRRTEVGALSVADALPVEDALRAGGRDPREGLGHLPEVSVDESGAADVAHGRAVGGDAQGTCLIVSAGILLAVGEGDGEGHIRPRVVLAPAGQAGRGAV
ncbi:MAG: tRNA pseudouridine(55) synthase TruB [Miltoncostaeaceae bacterium]